MENSTNLKDLLNKSATTYAEKLLYANENITYREFNNKVDMLKNELINIGLKSKKIGILSENRYEWELSFFSITCGVGIVVPIDKSLTHVEIENIINRAKIEAIFCSQKYESILYKIKETNTYLKHIISFDSDEFNEMINNQGTETFEEHIDHDETCAVFFTSGTTNTSKAVMLSHRNICNNIENVSKVFPITCNDVCLSVLPLNHVLEGLFCFLLSIKQGATRIFCNELEDIIEHIKKEKITFMGAVPAVYDFLYQRHEELKQESSHINMFMSGGARLPEDLLQKYKDIGIDLVQGYGLTECAPVVSIENKSFNKVGSVR